MNYTNTILNINLHSIRVINKNFVENKKEEALDEIIFSTSRKRIDKYSVDKPVCMWIKIN